MLQAETCWVKGQRLTGNNAMCLSKIISFYPWSLKQMAVTPQLRRFS